MWLPKKSPHQRAKILKFWLFDFFQFWCAGQFRVCSDILCRAFTQTLKWVTFHPHCIRSTSVSFRWHQIKTYLGMVLAGLNLPNGPVYANFTEELFHTDQFQVLIKLHREHNQDSYSQFQNFSPCTHCIDLKSLFRTLSALWSPVGKSWSPIGSVPCFKKNGHYTAHRAVVRSVSSY